MNILELPVLITAGILCLFIAIYFVIQIEKCARKKWMSASTNEILIVSTIMIFIFSILLIIAMIRVGLLIADGTLK